MKYTSVQCALCLLSMFPVYLRDAFEDFNFRESWSRLQSIIMEFSSAPSIYVPTGFEGRTHQCQLQNLQQREYIIDRPYWPTNNILSIIDIDDVVTILLKAEKITVYHDSWSWHTINPSYYPLSVFDQFWPIVFKVKNVTQLQSQSICHFVAWLIGHIQMLC